MDLVKEVLFWKGILNIEDYVDENGLKVCGMTDKLFVEECVFYRQQLLLNNVLFYSYYVTYWDHIDHVPYVVRMRYLASFAAAG